MAAYVMVELEVHDRQKMKPYLDNVMQTVADHGGKYLIRTDELEIKEGNAGQYPTKVVLEFPNLDAANAWYDSDAYQAIVPNRLEHSSGNFLIVDGFNA